MFSREEDEPSSILYWVDAHFLEIEMEETFSKKERLPLLDGVGVLDGRFVRRRRLRGRGNANKNFRIKSNSSYIYC